jgi:HK97 family phage prohead protease
MRDFEAKNFSFEVKAIDDNTFEGYAAVFRNIDSYGDIIEPGAFTKTIQESKRVKVLWQHDPQQPIGKPEIMQEDNHGLYVKAKISQTKRGIEAMQLMKDGVIDELSIGFNSIKDEWNKETGNRHIKEIKLWEFSPVTFAANDQANITSAKGINPMLVKMQTWIDGELKAGKVLSEKNKTIVSDAIAALQALLDATEKGVEPPKSTQQVTEVDEKAANDILEILKEMQNFTKK